MSLRMMSDVLALRDIRTHCPLCGRKFGRVAKTDEHIFPGWLQRLHDLRDRRLNLPNFVGKTYKSVRIEICEKCNGERFGQLESELSKVIRAENPFNELQKVGAERIAAWMGKILWLLARKGYAYPDHRTLSDSLSENIVPGRLMPGLTFLGMYERTFSMRKRMQSCFLNDPPVPKIYYQAPFSLYIVELDTRDQRLEGFDFVDDLSALGVAIRSGSVGLICLFDGGIHRHCRQQRYSHILSEKLHPVQFGELAARIFYDDNVLCEQARRVQYFWNRELKSVIAQVQISREFDPYLAENHDPRILADMVGRYTCTNPDDILQSDGRIFTTLEKDTGEFLKFAVTDDELKAARDDHAQVIMGPLHHKWRLNGPLN